jgi:hypothetical protein
MQQFFLFLGCFSLWMLKKRPSRAPKIHNIRSSSDDDEKQYASISSKNIARKVVFLAA